ncbi:MAG: hypothetical protein VXW30_02300, partial [Candidatus Thermoplasmatota archaeon]|nr:hypothetical protein [Candidatus Thermoplasmatota archaeon]
IDFGRSSSDWLILWTINHPSLPSLDLMPIEAIQAWSNPPSSREERMHERWQEIARREIDLLLQRGWILEMTSADNKIKMDD